MTFKQTNLGTNQKNAKTIFKKMMEAAFFLQKSRNVPTFVL
jgi:hypothetical protein